MTLYIARAFSSGRASLSDSCQYPMSRRSRTHLADLEQLTEF